MSPNNTERAHQYVYPTVTPGPNDIITRNQRNHHPDINRYGEQTEVPQGGYEQPRSEVTRNVAHSAVSQLVERPSAPESERFEAAA